MLSNSTWQPHLSARAACAALLAFTLAGCDKHPAPKQQGAVPVTVAAAVQGPQSSTLSGLGHVQGFNTALARAQTYGLIVAIDFKEGQLVRAGQPLAQIDPRPLQAQLAQDEAALQRDLAALANARDNFNRTSPLVSGGLASAQQVEGYRAQVAQLSATVAGDRATLQRDRLTLAYATIRAPISGVTGVRQVDTGNLVGPSDPTGLVSVVQVQPIAVEFTLPQSAVGAVRAGMSARGAAGVQVDVLAQDSGEMLDRGQLVAIDNRVDDASGTVMLKAVFPNLANRLWPGQQVTARVVLGVDPAAVTIPASALQSDAHGPYVWVVDAGNRAKLRPVVPGARLGDAVIIRSGVGKGDRVVTDGQFALVAGAPVTIAAAGPTRHDNPDQLGLNP